MILEALILNCTVCHLNWLSNGYFFGGTRLFLVIQNALHCERYHTATNLNGLRFFLFQLNWLVGHDKSAKLAQVVLKEEALRVGVVIL